MTKVISIDPGSKKCGILLADMKNLSVLKGKIVQKYLVVELINSWLKDYTVDLILLGNGTTSQFWHAELVSNKIAPIQLVDETFTTLRAKERYFELFPPKFIFKLLPKTLILPPKNLDAVVALLFIEDYFGKKLQWPGPFGFKT